MASKPKTLVILAGTFAQAGEFAEARGLQGWIWPRSSAEVRPIEQPEVYVLPSFDGHPLHATLAPWVQALLNPTGRSLQLIRSTPMLR